MDEVIIGVQGVWRRCSPVRHQLSRQEICCTSQEIQWFTAFSCSARQPSVESVYTSSMAGDTHHTHWLKVLTTRQAYYAHMHDTRAHVLLFWFVMCACIAFFFLLNRSSKSLFEWSDFLWASILVTTGILALINWSQSDATKEKGMPDMEHNPQNKSTFDWHYDQTWHCMRPAAITTKEAFLQNSKKEDMAEGPHLNTWYVGKVEHPKQFKNDSMRQLTANPD